MNMKTIKSFGLILMLAVLGACFNSCSEEYESRLHELLINSQWDFNSSDAAEQSQTLRNEDLTNYGISADSVWCSVDIDYNSSTIKVRVTENQSYDDRTCTVTLKDVRSGDLRSFKVWQKKTRTIKISDTEYQVDSDGGDITITVEENVGYKVEIPSDIDWITEKPASTRGLEKHDVTLTVAKNNSGSYRSGTISIKNTDGDSEIVKKILVKQTFTPIFTLEQNAFTIDELAQTVSIKITTNLTKFDTYINDEEWISSSGRDSTGIDTKTQKLSVLKFTDKKDSRTGTIDFHATVKTAEGIYKDIDETVTITQNRTLYIPKDSIYLSVGDSTNIEFRNTEKRTLVWSSSDESKFTVDSNGKLKCISSEGDGLATITMKSNDGKYSDQVIAVAKKPSDLSKYLFCKWDSTTTTKEGVSSTTLTFKITNTSTESIKLTGYTAYKDSADVADASKKWYEETLSENLGANGSRTINLGAVPTTNYYMALKYTYMNENYILGYSKNGVMTITKETKAAAARRRSANAARSRRK